MCGAMTELPPLMLGIGGQPMADILIRGMEMPPTGNYFVMIENEPGIEPNVTVWKRQQNGELKHFSFCPLVELPEHGDLIDRDALPQDRV